MLVKPGRYAIVAVFKNRKDQLVKQGCGSFYTYSEMTLDAALDAAKSWISMTGLHNFGLATTERCLNDGRFEYDQEVVFKVVQVEDQHHQKVAPEAAAKYGSRCRVNASGHIVG